MDRVKQKREPDYGTEVQPASGYGIVADGTIDLRTVSNTVTATIVNALLLYRDLVVRRDVTDAQVRELWLKNIGDDNPRYKLVPVVVTRVV